MCLKMAGTVAKKTADVHSIDSKKTDIQHVENLFQRIYDFLLGILETMWTEGQATFYFWFCYDLLCGL